MGSVKGVASHPVSTWSAIAAAVIAIATAWTDHQETKKYTESFEEGHYEALVDLRKKVDYLFGKFVEVDIEVAALRASGAVVRPPGPAQPSPPPTAPDTEGAEDEVAQEDLIIEFVRMVEKIRSTPPVEERKEDKKEEKREEKKEEKEGEKKGADSKQQQVPFDLGSDGKIKWTPIKRK